MGKCTCMGLVGVPNAKGGFSGLAMNVINEDCRVHGTHGKKKAKKEAK